MLDALKIIDYRMEQMMDPNLLGYYISDYVMLSEVTNEYCNQIDFGNPEIHLINVKHHVCKYRHLFIRFNHLNFPIIKTLTN